MKAPTLPGGSLERRFRDNALRRYTLFGCGSSTKRRCCASAACGSEESDDLVRHVRLFERGNLLSREFYIHAGERLVEVVQLGGTDDWRGATRLCQQPGQRHLS